MSVFLKYCGPSHNQGPAYHWWQGKHPYDKDATVTIGLQQLHQIQRKAPIRSFSSEQPLVEEEEEWEWVELPLRPKPLGKAFEEPQEPLRADSEEAPAVPYSPEVVASQQRAIEDLQMQRTIEVAELYSPTAEVREEGTELYCLCDSIGVRIMEVVEEFASNPTFKV